MQVPSLPSDLAIVVAGIASIASHWLRDDGLSARINALISIAALIITAGICIYLTSGFSGSLKDDTLLLIATAFALAGKEAVALLGYIQYTSPSPLAPLVSKHTSTVRPTIRATTPTGGDRGQGV